MKVLFAILVLLISLTGCHKKPEETKNSLRVNFQEGDLPSLHPHDLVTHLRGLSIAKLLFEPLTRIDSEGQIKLAAAETVSISDDQLHYTFHLRENYWSDGTRVTASQYAEAWKYALAPSSPCSRAELLYVLANGEKVKKRELSPESLGIHAIDDKTLVVDLEFPTPFLFELLAQVIAAPLVDPKDHQKIHFNGPFQVQTWKKGDSMKLIPNPYYWDHANISLNQIDISFIEDANTVFTLYEKGDLDWIGVPLCPLSAEQIQRLQAKGQIHTQAIGRSFWIFLNTENQILASPLIRQALSLAIDRKAITNHILLGGLPSIKPLSQQLLPTLEQSQLQEDLALAKKVFQQGLSQLELTSETLPPLEISYSQQAARKQVAEYLQETWHKHLGIDVRLKSVEWNVLRSNLEKGLFTISMAYEGAFYKDPLELLERYATLNPSNFSRWLNSQFTYKIAQAKFEANSLRRTQILSEAEQIAIEEMPFIPISSDRFLFSHSPNLSGYVIDSIGAIDFSRAIFQ